MIKIASIWCVINLTWIEDEGAKERINELKRLKIDLILQRMVIENENDVKERVKTALQNFSNEIIMNDDEEEENYHRSDISGFGNLVAEDTDIEMEFDN